MGKFTGYFLEAVACSLLCASAMVNLRDSRGASDMPPDNSLLGSNESASSTPDSEGSTGNDAERLQNLTTSLELASASANVLAYVLRVRAKLDARRTETSSSHGTHTGSSLDNGNGVVARVAQ